MFKMYLYKSLISPGAHSFNINDIKIVENIILRLDKVAVLVCQGALIQKKSHMPYDIITLY